MFVCVHNWNPSDNEQCHTFLLRVLQSSHVEMEKDLQKAKAYSMVQAELKKYRLVVYCQGSKDFIMQE